jgi:peptidoglycan/LPS O-acetylase OafA/YrhL
VPHRPALDGLRAVSVLLVVVLHATYGGRWLPGGFLGVDIFFVISGFLITALLIAEWTRTQTLDLRAFYARRALRLLPALFVTVAGVCLLQAVVGAVPGAAPLWQSITATLFYVANWLQLAHPAATGYLDHTWSLAIEEQFYLVWPWLLLLALRRGVTPRRLAAGCSVAAVAVLAARALVFAASAPGPNTYKLFYVGTVFRADSLLAGIVVAALFADAVERRGARRFSRSLPEPLRRAVAEALPWAGAAGLAACVYRARLRAPWLYHGGYTLVALCAAVVVAHLAFVERSWFSRLLSLPPLVGVGRISYGIYLYHLPIAVLVLEHTRWSPLTRLAVIAPSSVVAATISWFALERWALRAKRRVTPRRRDLLADPVAA